MINRFLGLLPIFYSAYQYYDWYNTPGFNPNNLFWVKLGVSFVLGLFMLIFSNYKYVLDYLQKVNFVKSSPVVEKVDADKTEQEKQVDEYYDLRCLLHLRSRVTELSSEEGVQIVTRLNTILFSKGKI